MNSLFAGFMGLLSSFSSFFHSGQPQNHPMMNTTVANTTASASGSITPGIRRGEMMQNGERSFFGTVTSVNGSTITLEMQRPVMMMRQVNPSITPTITPPAAKTITITVDSTTTYTGGSLSDITTGTKIAGIGKSTGDSAITAVKITINPTVPTGFPSGMPRGGRFHEGGPRGMGQSNDRDPQ